MQVKCGAVCFGIAVYGQVSQGLVGIGCVIHLYAGHTQCLQVLVKHAQYVFGRIGHHTVYLYTGYHHHGHVLLLKLVAHCPLRFLTAHVQRECERFRHAVAVCYLYLFVVRAYVYIGRYAERNGQLIQGVYVAAGL